MSKHEKELKIIRQEVRSRCGIVPAIEAALKEIEKCGAVKDAIEAPVEESVEESVEIPYVSQPTKSYSFTRKSK